MLYVSLFVLLGSVSQPGHVVHNAIAKRLKRSVSAQVTLRPRLGTGTLSLLHHFIGQSKSRGQNVRKGGEK